LDRDGTVPVTDDVCAGSHVPGCRSHWLIETCNAERLQLAYCPAGMGLRHIVVEHVVWPPWRDHLTVDHPPRRSTTVRQAEHRLADIELKSRYVDEVSHVGDVVAPSDAAAPRYECATTTTGPLIR
jgi:hypothetical protein